MNEGGLPSFGAALLWTVTATALVALVAWAALTLLRRALAGRGARLALPRRPGGRLRVVQSVPLGARERAVVLVDEEREYLLGVAAGSVRLLSSRALETGKIPSDDTSEARGGAAPDDPREGHGAPRARP